MTFDHIHREEAPHVGDPADASVAELAGIAPPCEKCRTREMVATVDGQKLCQQCLTSASNDTE
jgi:hypothetical protein